MTPREFKRARQTLGLTLSNLADILGVDARTVRKWEAEHGNSARPPSPMAVKVLGWMMKPGRPPEWPGQK